jgi:predicted DNA-binding protein
VTLADDVLEELELWASEQGRTTAGLAAFLIEVAVRHNRSRVDLPHELSEKLKRLAASQGRTVVSLAQNLLMEAIRQADEANNPEENEG